MFSPRAMLRQPACELGLQGPDPLLAEVAPDLRGDRRPELVGSPSRFRQYGRGRNPVSDPFPK